MTGHTAMNPRKKGTFPCTYVAKVLDYLNHYLNH